VESEAPEIVFVAGSGQFLSATYNVSDGTFEAETPVPLFEHPVLRWGFPESVFDIHPDGERFLVVDTPDLRDCKVVIVQNWFEELKRLVPVD